MNSIKRISTALLIFAIPTIVSAQFTVQKIGLDGDEGEGTSFAQVVSDAAGFFNSVFAIVFVLVFFFFMVTLLRLMLGIEDPEKRKQVKFMLTWGIIGLFVLISFAGIVTLTQETINL